MAVRDLTIDLERSDKGSMQRVEVSRAEILGLDVSQRPGRKRLGVAAGVLAGFGAALAIGIGPSCSGSRSAASCAPGVATCNDTVANGCAAASALRGFLTMPLGGLLGYVMAPGEKWRPAEVRELSVQPTLSRGGGIRIRLVIGF